MITSLFRWLAIELKECANQRVLAKVLALLSRVFLSQISSLLHTTVFPKSEGSYGEIELNIKVGYIRILFPVATPESG